MRECWLIFLLNARIWQQPLPNLPAPGTVVSRP
jgi:hypothetical protein